MDFSFPLSASLVSRFALPTTTPAPAPALFAHLQVLFYPTVYIASLRHCCLITRSSMQHLMNSSRDNSYCELCFHCHLHSMQNGLLMLQFCDVHCFLDPGIINRLLFTKFVFVHCHPDHFWIHIQGGPNKISVLRTIGFHCCCGSLGMGADKMLLM